MNKLIASLLLFFSFNSLAASPVNHEKIDQEAYTYFLEKATQDPSIVKYQSHVVQKLKYDTTDLWGWKAEYYKDKYVIFHLFGFDNGMCWAANYDMENTDLDRWQPGDPLSFEPIKLGILDSRFRVMNLATLTQVDFQLLSFKSRRISKNQNGKKIFLTDGSTWSFSWWDSWSTAKWEYGTLIIMLPNYEHYLEGKYDIYHPNTGEHFLATKD